jgi:hypothetical protein
MDPRVAETESVAAYDAVPTAYTRTADGQRRAVPTHVASKFRLRVELQGARAPMSKPIERGLLRLDLILGPTPDPRFEAGEVRVASTYVTFDDGSGRRACVALVAKSDVFPPPELDEAGRERSAEALAEALLAKVL